MMFALLLPAARTGPRADGRRRNRVTPGYSRWAPRRAVRTGAVACGAMIAHVFADILRPDVRQVCGLPDGFGVGSKLPSSGRCLPFGRRALESEQSPTLEEVIGDRIGALDERHIQVSEFVLRELTGQALQAHDGRRARQSRTDAPNCPSVVCEAVPDSAPGETEVAEIA